MKGKLSLLQKIHSDPHSRGTPVQVNSSSYNMDTKKKGSLFTVGSEDFNSQYFDNLHLSSTEIKKTKAAPVTRELAIWSR